MSKNPWEHEYQAKGAGTCAAVAKSNFGKVSSSWMDLDRGCSTTSDWESGDGHSHNDSARVVSS